MLNIKTWLVALTCCSALGWADPQIEWTCLRVSRDENKAFCSVWCTQLQDMKLEERQHAYAVFYVADELSWIVYLGKISPHTENIGTVCYAPWSQVEAWNKAEIVVCPIDDEGVASEMASLRWDDRFSRPIPKPRPKETFNMQGPNPHWKGQSEAQDASLQVNTKDHC